MLNDDEIKRRLLSTTAPGSREIDVFEGKGWGRTRSTSLIFPKQILSKFLILKIIVMENGKRGLTRWINVRFHLFWWA